MDMKIFESILNGVYIHAAAAAPSVNINTQEIVNMKSIM